MTDDLDRAAAWWDSLTDQYSSEGTYQNRAHWKIHPAVIRNTERLLGNQTSGVWLANQLGAPARRAMSVGSGTATFEIDLVQRGAVEQCDLWDVSASALEKAVSNARAAGVADRISVHCGDALSSTDRGYDGIIFQDSLHHALNVAETIEFAQSVLRPGGWLFAEEYVGPRRFGFPQDDVQLAQRLYRLLDPDLLCEWPELPLPDPAAVADADPTEAVESDLILGLLGRTFSDCRTVLLGGALPYIIWHGLNHDALWETERGRELVDVLLDLDRALTESQILPSYFAVVLARDLRRRGWKRRIGL